MDDKKKKLYAAALACVVLLAGFAWFLCAGRADVSDIRNGAQHVRNELESARSAQSAEGEALERAEAGIGRSEERIERIEERSAEIAGLNRTDAEIIGQSKSILTRIQERGGTENQN